MSDDPRIDKLIVEVASIKKTVCANSTVVQEVRDILNSFKLIATVAKFCTLIAAGGAVVYAAFNGLIHHIGDLFNK